MTKLKAAKVVNVITRTIGWLVVAGVVFLIGNLLVAWAFNHFFSFAIVVGIVALIGVVIAYVWSSDVLTEEKNDEAFFQKHGRYETDQEKKARHRREQMERY